MRNEMVKINDKEITVSFPDAYFWQLAPEMILLSCGV